ncbi:MAG: 50S ribosomal protein L4 [Bacteroidales bacterium]|jgi:large subunit ribosomal protein L4|nr:50S ribosomal protein L4 [Bacteroidales bacterium]
MDVKVYNKEGKETSKKVTLRKEIFGAQPNDHAIYLDVKRILAERRQGTHDSRERSDLSGSTRKLYRQKGTGGARRGDIKSPLLRGGARAFGPHPRDYGFKVNKKVKKLARISALSYKASEEVIRIIEDLNFSEPKTKDFNVFLKNFDSQTKKSLIVLDELNKNVYLSSRNLKKVKIITSSDLNTYDILDAQNLFISENSLAKLEEILLEESK